MLHANFQHLSIQAFATDKNTSLNKTKKKRKFSFTHENNFGPISATV